MVADGYDAVPAKVEALYRESALPADAEGPNMRELREQVNHRLLGNGWCRRRPSSTAVRVDLGDVHALRHRRHVHARPTASATTPGANLQEVRAAMFDGLLAGVEQNQ